MLCILASSALSFLPISPATSPLALKQPSASRTSQDYISHHLRHPCMGKRDMLTQGALRPSASLLRTQTSCIFKPCTHCVI